MQLVLYYLRLRERKIDFVDAKYGCLCAFRSHVSFQSSEDRRFSYLQAKLLLSVKDHKYVTRYHGSVLLTTKYIYRN